MRSASTSASALVLALLSACDSSSSDTVLRDGSVADAATTEDAAALDDAAQQADAAPPPACELSIPSFTTSRVGGRDFNAPVFATHAPGDPGSIYIVERAGRIQRVDADGQVSEFLDARALIGSAPSGGDERGLLGLAFHPDYADNGRFFIGYSPTSSDHNIVAELARTPDSTPPTATATVVRTYLETDDPETNHNGGMIAFGPDGMLYAGIGDGGGAGDEHGTIGNGLDLDSPLGKLHRFDVDGVAPFVPSDNPFASGGGVASIWAYGLRNPWRFSFDRENGALLIADVGQSDWEEVNHVAGDAAGLNYGWRAYEGTHVYDDDLLDIVAEHAEPTMPIAEFSHSSRAPVLAGACSITGGYVYRGAHPQLHGYYFFGDACSPDVATIRVCGEGSYSDPAVVDDLSDLAGTLVSFGETTDGELLLVYLDGTVLSVNVLDGE